MSAMSNYLEQKLNDHVLGGGDFTRPGTVYFALFTGVSNGDAGTVTEVSGGGYARASVTNNTTNWNNTTTPEGTKTNKTAIIFPTSSGSWGIVTHFGIYDSSSSGNLLYWGELTSSRTIASGDTPRFNAGEFSITFD